VSDEGLRKELFEAFGKIGRLEGELAETRRALEQQRTAAAASLDDRRIEADLLREDVEQIAYLASHDLQEPLRNVITMTQLLQDSLDTHLDPDTEEMIGVAVSGSLRLHGLVHDLLAYSRVVTQGRPMAATDLHKAVERAEASLGDVLQRAGGEVTHDPLPIVVADTNQMVQLMQNLIANAIKFCGDRPPRVHIAVEEQDRHWRVSVRDNGRGIEPDYLQTIFRPLRRPHAPGEYEGSGIGLAICRRIVLRHRGEIWAESQPGEGAIFHFTLPKEMGVPETA